MTTAGATGRGRLDPTLVVGHGNVYLTPKLFEDGSFGDGPINGFVAAFDAATGREKWRRKTGKAAGGTAFVPTGPATAGPGADLVFVPIDNSWHALSPDTGKAAWRLRLPDHWFGMPALQGGVLYASSAAGVRAVRAGTGA